MDIIQALKEELQIGRNQVEAAVKLIDEGNTIPFIARYRKEATGSLNDEVLRQLDERLRYLRNLEDKKEQVIGAIRAQEKLTQLRQEYNDGNPQRTALELRNPQGYLDNMDLFALTLPVKLDGFGITPWVMYGMMGKNTTTNFDNTNGDYDNHAVRHGNPGFTLFPYPVGASINGDGDTVGYGGTSKAYGSMFWAGLPMTLTMFDPLNVELDINYGYVESMGRYSVQKGQNGPTVRGSMGRQGWLAKALVEYKMDWATPGLFGWYATGDDNSVKNGSERMPSIVPVGNFTSFMGDGNMGWFRQDYGVDYAGTWGIGAQLKDMSFLEDLKHTFRIAYWGGTNSTSMVKYMANAYSWNDATGTQATVPYMTTNDGLVEFNLVNSYKIYQNLEMNLELDYLVNCMDNSTWKKAQNPSSFQKQDMYSAKVVFAYTF